MNNSQLIIACKNRDRKAQKELYELYGPIMMGICKRYTDNDDSARDLLHDGFIQVFTQIGSFEGRGSFEGWMKRVFVNIALMNYRQEAKKRKFLEEMEVENTSSAAPDEDFFDLCNVTKTELLDAIRELPPGYKMVVNLYIFEEMSHREIAQALGISEAGSRSQYSRAKSLLHKKITTLLKRKERQFSK